MTNINTATDCPDAVLDKLIREVGRLRKIEKAARGVMQYQSTYGNGEEFLALGLALAEKE